MWPPSRHQLEPGTRNQLGHLPGLERRRQHVGGAADDKGRDANVRQIGSQVEPDEHARRVAARLVRALEHHAPDELDVARPRVLAEADACGEKAQVGSGPQPGGVGRVFRELFESRLRARGPRTERRVREGGEQHDPGHSARGDVGKLGDEALHRDAAHRVTDENRVVEVEPFEHGLEIEAEVVERLSFVADDRPAVTAMVERDDTKAVARASLRADGSRSSPRASHRVRARWADRRRRRARRCRSNRRRAYGDGDRRTRERETHAPRRDPEYGECARRQCVARRTRGRRDHRSLRPRCRRAWQHSRQIPPGNPRPDAAHDRIGDRAAAVGPLLRVDALAALAYRSTRPRRRPRPARRRRRSSTDPSSRFRRSGIAARESVPRHRDATTHGAHRRRIRSERLRAACASSSRTASHTKRVRPVRSPGRA